MSRLSSSLLGLLFVVAVSHATDVSLSKRTVSTTAKSSSLASKGNKLNDDRKQRRHATMEQQQQQRNAIVNGQPAAQGAYPYFAISGEGSFILASDSRCGASLIHSDILLSAAHCQGAFNYETLLYNAEDGSYNREVEIDAQRRYLAYGTVLGELNYDIMVCWFVVVCLTLETHHIPHL